jgi:glucan biosynthesis protein C
MQAFFGGIWAQWPIAMDPPPLAARPFLQERVTKDLCRGERGEGLMRSTERPPGSTETAHVLAEVAEAPSARMVYLDRLRIGLTVLVVLHHVAMSFGAGGPAFYYVDLPETIISRNLLVFVLFNQAWFMGAFFLVAGYFTPRSLDRKGTVGFLRSRVVRLGIPLVVFSLVLNPLAMTGWFHVADWLGPYTADTFDWVEHIGMGPTWFLAMLLIFSFGYALVRRLVGGRLLSSAVTKPPGLVMIGAFVLVLAIAGFLMRLQVAVGESWAGFPSLGYLPQYIALFTIGIVAARRDWLSQFPVTTAATGLGAAILASVLLFPLAFSGQWFSLELTETLPEAMGDGYWRSAVYALWDATLAVGLIVGLIVILRGVTRRESAAGRFLTQNSYATYFVHIPIVVYVAVLVGNVGFGHTGRLLLAAAVAVPVSFLAASAVRKLPGAGRVF